MDGTGDYHIMQGKSDQERQILDIFSHMEI
jgi:hypothetical protein